MHLTRSIDKSEQSSDLEKREVFAHNLPLQSQKHGYMPFLSPLWLYLLIAFLVRLWLVLHTNGVIEGDESLVGIQAERILHGEYPIYFYGQPYMGSLEAYLITLVFAVVGPSVWALRMEPILLSVLLVGITWKLAAALADTAHLALYAKRYFMHVATLVAAVAPLYDAVLELHTLGGYIEIFVLMLLLLLATVHLLRRWGAEASLAELALRWAGIGFIIGLGFWVNPLLLSAVIATALWIAGYWIIAFIKAIRFRKQAPKPAVPVMVKGLCAALAAIPACLLGSAPALYWGFQHGWENVSYLVNRGNGTSIDTASNLAQHYVLCIAPQVIGGGLFDERIRLRVLQALSLTLGIGCTLATVALVVLPLFWHRPLLRRIQRLAAYPLLFGLCNAIFFCIGTGPIDCTRDYISRYATPLVLVLPLFIATTFTSVVIWLCEWRKDEQEIVGAMPSARPGPFRSLFSFSRKSPIGLYSGVLFGLLLIALGTQVMTYGLTDAGLTLQSPSCVYAPAQNEAIIAYLQQEHVHYAWGISWIGYPIIFKTNGSIIVADPRPVIIHAKVRGRVPEYIEAVSHAQRPAMLTFIAHGDRHPLLLRTLAKDGVIYRAKVFPSEPGTDVLVVMLLNRTVSLLESSAFLEVFVHWGCEIPRKA